MTVPNYTDPTTVNGGESGQIASNKTITSALMQTMVNNENALAAAVSQNTANIQTLQSNSGSGSGSSAPAATQYMGYILDVTQNASWTPTNNNFTSFTNWAGASVNYETGISYNTGTGAVTIPQTGVYVVSSTMGINSSAAGESILPAVYSSSRGTQAAVGSNAISTTSGQIVCGHFSETIQLTAGDTLTFQYYATASSYGLTGAFSRCTVAWLG